MHSTNINNVTSFIQTDIRIVYWNTRSIVNRLEELRVLLRKTDIFIGVETWLNDSTPTAKLKFPGFVVLRKDRTYSVGGGIVFIIKNNLAYKSINNLISPNPYTELLGITLTNCKENINIIACYRPPSRVHFNTDHSVQDWCNIFDNTKLENKTLMVGDFNSHNVVWNCEKNDSNGSRLLYALADYDLILLNSDTKTHIDFQRGTKSNIDLAFVTPSLSHEVVLSVDNDPRVSDHYPININFTVEKAIYKKKTFKLNTKRTDWSKFREYMNEKMEFFDDDSFVNQSVLKQYDFFITEVKQAIINSSPKKVVNSKKKSNNPVEWWDSECDKIKRLRKASLLKWEYSLKLEDLILYKKNVALAKKIFKNKKRQYFRQFAATINLKSNLKYAWNKAKIFKDKWVKLQPHSVEHNLQENLKIESALDKLCTPYVSSNSDSLPFNKRNIPLFDAPFNFTEFNIALKSRKYSSAPGTDGITYEALDNLQLPMKLKLLDIFNHMFQNMAFPEEWKEIFIHFIAKPNSDDLRPIALTSCVCKLLEIMVANKFRWWLEREKILPDSQMGFRKGFSCMDNVTNVALLIEESFQKKEHTLGVFLDVVGAFLNVQPDILAKTLDQIGCPTNLIKFCLFLSQERLVFTQINSESPRILSKGVPIGGILSPILYIIYVYRIVEDLPEELKISQFADDLSIFLATKDPMQDKEILETAIETINKKLFDLGLELSPKKTVFVHFNNNKILPGEMEINCNNVIYSAK